MAELRKRQNKILIVGAERVLVGTRAAILGKRCRVVTALPADMLQFLREDHFELLLVCNSIPIEQAVDLVAEAHDDFPSLLIVQLLTASLPTIVEPIAHLLITIDFKPQNWLAAVDSLLNPRESMFVDHAGSSQGAGEKSFRSNATRTPLRLVPKRTA